MRFFSLFLSVLLLSGVMFAQKKYLVSPKQEVMPIERGKGAASLIQKKMRTNRGSISSVSDCSGQFTFGYDTLNYVPTSRFGAYHKDVMGQWYVAKATGQIDSILFETNAAIGTYDSTITIRVHRSLIGPNYGPGSPATPWFNPPCQNWGYWVNTNDLDQGVAAFIEEATDSDWVSTINGSIVPSGPPFSNELWGLGGFPKKIRPSSVENVAISALFTTLPVTLGDQFFISMRVQPPPTLTGHIDESVDTRTEWSASGFTVTTADEDYPSRNWKFYEHDKGPSNCAGFPVDSIRRGWVARGGFATLPTSVGAYNFWYTMTVTDNTSPQIEIFDKLGTTIDVGPRVVAATISDCNLADSSQAGVQSAVIKWSINGVNQADVAMDYLGGDEFEGEIPGVDRDNVVTYRIVATDMDGATSQTNSVSYRIINLFSQYYSVDTSGSCVTQDISANGTKIDTSAFWILNYTNAGTNAKDDGTAGPIDMGGSFAFFGDTFRYAWVGVNGAIALTYDATDTNQASANGFATTTWDFPNSVHISKNDTVNTNAMPPMFISPMWADHIISLDSPVTELGRIITGNNGDACKFIVQWDSIAAFNTDGDPEGDNTTFRVVLDRCTGIVEFQYESVGTHGLDSAALVGMQLDSLHYVFVNNQNAPYETKPRNNWCVKLYPAYGFAGQDGWNMLSVAGNAPDYNKTSLYPYAVSPAYKYAGGYSTAAVLENGPGYWLKYDGAHPIAAAGTYKSSVVINLNDKWNMIGSISAPVAIGDIAYSNAAPSSNYFKYQGGYSVASTIEPGRGYWIKVAKGVGAATATLDDGPAAAPKGRPVEKTNLQSLNKVTVSDAYGNSQTLYLSQESAVREGAEFYELPPVAVQGAYDVRFSASQRMLETYPASLAKDKSYEFPVAIQAMRYPVTVKWEMAQGTSVDGRKFILSVAGKQVVMDAAGKYVIQKDDVTSFSLGLKTGIEVPKQFALGQNYPNPFNPSTRFQVDVPKLTTVEVAVYDILGRKISTLMFGEQEAGSYQLEWNGTNSHQLTVPTGMYFIRMAGGEGEFSAVRKVMLMK